MIVDIDDDEPYSRERHKLVNIRLAAMAKFNEMLDRKQVPLLAPLLEY